eukprot:2904126-Alexandrium_andersonii.AAC.1
MPRTKAACRDVRAATASRSVASACRVPNVLEPRPFRPSPSGLAARCDRKLVHARARTRDWRDEWIANWSTPASGDVQPRS